MNFDKVKPILPERTVSRGNHSIAVQPPIDNIAVKQKLKKKKKYFQEILTTEEHISEVVHTANTS